MLAHAKVASIVAALLIAEAAFAHQGVANPAVKARMDSMSEIQENTKVLGSMAKGAIDFDKERARTAAGAIAAQAARMPGLFEAEESDPLSEALPAVWTRFDDFVDKAADLERVAGEAAAGLDTPQDLRSALAAIGGACKSCHESYRE